MLLERLKRKWHAIKERPWVIWTGGYAGGAWGVYEVFEKFTEFVSFPDSLLRSVPVLLLTGLPLAAVLAWYHAEKGKQKVTALEALLVAVIVGVGVAFVARDGRVPGVGWRVDEPRLSFLVEPVMSAGTSPIADDLAVDAATVLRTLLAGWREVRVITGAAHPGLAYGAGVLDASGGAIEESFAVAREAQVGTLARVAVEVIGAEAELRVTLIDVRSRLQRGPPLRNRGPVDDPQGLVLPVAMKVLGLAGAPEHLVLEPGTESLTAVQQMLDGQRQLERWELEGAAEAFRQSLALDSTFAQPHRLLGMALYWQAEVDPDRSDELRGDMERHAIAAVRYSSRLPYRDSVHAHAFEALANSRFADARTYYGDLLASDSTDVFALLMRGSVEYRDRGTLAGDSGVPATRGSLETAARSFLTAVRLAPTVSLGYGHLFDLYRRLADGERGCPFFEGFRPPGADDVPGFEASRPDELEFFCAARLDTLLWIHASAIEAADAAEMSRGAQEYLLRAAELIDQWARVDRASPRPLEEKAAWLLERRRRVFGTPSASRIDSIEAAALEIMRTALTLAKDTTPERLVWLGALHLMVDDDRQALALTEAGLAGLAERDGVGHDLPDVAVNVFLALGRIDRAEALALQAGWDLHSIPDPVTGSGVDFVADDELLRLELFGGVGYAEGVDSVMGRIEARWDEVGYPEERRRLLRRGYSPIVAPAMAFAPASAESWYRGIDDLPAHLRLLAGNAPNPSTVFDEALAASRSGRPTVSQLVVLAVFAARLGRHEDAITLWEEVARLPYSAERLSAGWGLRSLAQYYRARSLEEIGDAAAAAAAYETFLERWVDADPPLRAIVGDAREALGRIR